MSDLNTSCRVELASTNVSRNILDNFFGTSFFAKKYSSETGSLCVTNPVFFFNLTSKISLALFDFKI
ncbi:hypothetical protein KUTeg_014933 [Tegillarca granosa]|uniref:Uncharacterized protein n=1 Tax=Tegillarca granosa TaxID=220873 RepID=A0ABQ9ENQ9_TEGGR|nr:hypothetical protein KUTeg_014933 [Tegillarca granosa]